MKEVQIPKFIYQLVTTHMELLILLNKEEVGSSRQYLVEAKLTIATCIYSLLVALIRILP